ncbi:MAG: peroxidase family protein, partial [Paracoccaceae bacterium]|nr:peroxidase family protein [Paracoccaceae bacterium]
GHSMLNETVDRTYADGSDGSMTLFDAFLNPIAFDNDGALTAEQAARAILRGMTGQQGNEIDEFVTNVLRNQLVGIPLDLAAINIARGRDTGMPTLNEARAQFQELANGDTQLAPYTSWADFALNMQNPASLVNFIAAYGTHATITAETTIDGKRDAAMALVFGGEGAPADRLAFLNGPAAETGVNAIDLWVGGLAERKMPFGGMLGTTFAFVFELQMENLQDGDRFYYLSRTQGLNLLVELENNSLAKIAMRNTDLGETMFGLPMDVFARMDHTFYVDLAQQAALGTPEPEYDNPFLAAVSQLVERGPNYIRYNGYDHVAIAGTEGNDTIIGGNGDDALWGFGGDDRIEAGEGVDNLNGGAGDDIMTKIGAPVGETAVFKGESGNDVIHGGAGLPLIFGGSGQDFLMTGADGGEIRAGEDNDFVLGGEGQDVLFGNQGDDWVEAGLRADYIAGDMGDIFFNNTNIGHDVLNGGQGDTDYDADSGDDIMFAGEGIQKFIGMWGHDWVTHQGLSVAADADMNVEVFTTLPLEVLRDRYSQVEAVTGWHLDDVLRGDDRSFDGGGAIADPTPEGNFVFNELDQAGIDRISGLDQLITADMMQMMEYWADGSGVEKLAFAHGNILLGGGGSDSIEGRAGDDVIDGDAYLNVRLAIHAWDTNKNPILDGDGNPVILGSVQSIAGDLTLGGVTKTLPQWMLDGTINPGQLNIVREILHSDTGTDTAVYWDVVENYAISQRADGRLTIEHVIQSAGDLAVNLVTGRARLSDGSDTLGNIERLQFAGLTINTAQSAATGQPVISDLSPQVGQTLDVNLAGIQDANGVNAATFGFQWQQFVGGSWANITGATGEAFTVLAAQQSTPLRVVVSFTDHMGNAEQVTSEQTTPIFVFNGGNGNDTASGTPNGDILNGNGGNDNLSGLGGNDALFGGTGNDTLNGGAGDDDLDGGPGTDRAVFSGSVANFSFALDGATVVVADNTGTNGTDRLTSIEEAQFSEGAFTLRLGTNGNNNNINGNNGADLLLGFNGNDTLNASGGNDVLVGGAGKDALNGGSGNDTYLFGLSDGTDTITDGSGNGTADRIVIQANGAELATLSASDSNTGTQNGNLVLGFEGQQISVAGHYSGNNTQTGVEQITFGNATYAGYALGDGTYAISRDDDGARSGTGGNDLIAGELGA